MSKEDYYQVDDVILERKEVCKECKFPIIFIVCNFLNQNHTGIEYWDYYCYCANPTCIHHKGEDYNQGFPNWVIERPDEVEEKKE